VGLTLGSKRLYRAIPIIFRRSFWTAPALPKFICECGNVLLSGLVSDCAVFGRTPFVFFLCVNVSLIGVLKVLSGAFVSRQVIFFSVVLGAGPVGVGSKVTMLGGDLL